MAGSERVAKDVRELTRDRSRVRARMARRSENLQRGLVGAFAGLVLTIVLWLVAFFSALPIAAAAVATLLLGVYGAGLAYLMRAAARANLADREILEEIDAELGPRRAMGRRRASAVMRENSRKLANARAKAQLAADLEAARAAEASERRRRRSEARNARKAAGPGGAKDSRRVVDGARGAAGDAGGKAVGGSGVGRAVSARGGARGAASSSDAGWSAGDVIRTDGRPRVIGRDREDAEVGGAKALDARAEIAKARVAERMSASGAEAGAGRGGERAARPSPRAEMPSYTLKPRKIERRVVEPYAAPAGATAPVPYRPHGPGERYDAVSGAVVPPSTRERPSGADTGIPAWQEAMSMTSGGGSERSTSPSGRERTASEAEAGAGAERDAAAEAEGVIADEGVITAGSGEVLGGGSVLDALLDRRRA